MKRFIAKKFKLVHRNSMLAGNPIDKSFPVWGVFDRQWQEDRNNTGVSFHGYERSRYGYHGYAAEFRAVFRNEARAKEVIEKLNELDVQFGRPKSIGFRLIDHKFDPWLKDDDVIEVTSFIK